MLAALNGHYDIVEVLLDKGAQINFDHEVKVSIQNFVTKFFGIPLRLAMFSICCPR